MRLSVGSLLLLTLVSSFGGTIVQFRTSLGDLKVELFDSDKPVTVQNFLHYVQGGYYTNMVFHRVKPNFVIQGGGFEVVNRGTADAGLDYVTNFPAITNEFNVGRFYSNLYGTIAMAKRGGDANSATSQFFFNLADNSSSLDDPDNNGGFTVFGRVVSGTNILEHFRVGANNRLLKEAVWGNPYDPLNPFTELPVLYSTLTTNLLGYDLIVPGDFTDQDLIYVDVSLAPHYTPLKATYNGLVTTPTNVEPRACGALTVTTAAGPKFSGSLRVGTVRYSFSGAFDTNGYTVVTATSGMGGQLVLNLHPDAVLGTDKLVGSISAGLWVADVAANRVAFDGRSSPATNYLGKYTLTLPSSGQTNAPGGYGFATLSVSAAGKVTLKGSLADGTPVSQSAPLSRDGHFPLHVPLYACQGFLSGWLAYTNQPGAELTGALLWLKAAPNTGRFPGAFATPIAAVGGRYTAPNAGVNLLSLTNACIFGGDNPTLCFTNTLVLKTGNKLFNASANQLTVSLSSANGSFSGSVKPPGSTCSLPFKGALWQNRGYGYFLNGSQSGWVLLQP